MKDWNTNEQEVLIDTPAYKQIVYLDFDGETTKYSNTDLGLYIDNISVENSGLSQDRIQQITYSLNEQYADKNIIFVTERPEDEEYSTVYVGKTDAFDSYGSFLGLAETIDADNQIKNDNAFVLQDSSSNNDEIISVISHEVEHIAEGMQHDACNGTLDDYASGSYTVTGSTLNLGSTSFPLTISGNLSNSVSVKTSGNGYYDCITFRPTSSGTVTIKNNVSLLFGAKHTIRTYLKVAQDSSIVTVASFHDSSSASVSLTAGKLYYFYVEMLSPSSYTTTNYTYTASISSGSTPTTTTKPDLVVSSFTASSSNISRTDPLTLYFTIKNNGKATAGSSVAYIQNGSTTLAKISVPSLAAGETFSYSYYRSPGILSSNTFKVLADAYADVNESNENNNSATCTVTQSFPDLIITSLSASSSTAFTTDKITLSFTVKNKGDVSSGENFAYIYDGSKLIGQEKIYSLSAGISASYSYTVYPGTLSEGTHSLKVVVDGNQVINESNEYNNDSSTCSVTVKIPKTDLGISSLTTSASTISATDRLTLEFTVKNNGDLAAGANFAHIYDGTTKIGQVTAYRGNP